MITWEELKEYNSREISMLNAEIISRKIKIKKLKQKDRYYVKKIEKERG